MKLYDNWLTLVKKAWSLRFIAIGFLLTMLEYIIPSLAVEPWVIGVFMAAAGIARLVAQKGVDE